MQSSSGRRAEPNGRATSVCMVDITSCIVQYSTVYCTGQWSLVRLLLLTVLYWRCYWMTDRQSTHVYGRRRTHPPSGIDSLSAAAAAAAVAAAAAAAVASETEQCETGLQRRRELRLLQQGLQAADLYKVNKTLRLNYAMMM
jgi:hypothetical protein